MTKQEVILGDALEVIKKMYDESVDVIFTSPSPPNFEKDENMIGGEKHIDSYLANLGILFRECKRVLKKTGSLWVQMGSYHNKDGDLLLTAEVFLYNMFADGWHLKSKLVWHRINGLKYQEDYNRFARDWEHLFFFTKEKDGYYFNNPNKAKLSSVIQASYRPPKKNRFESGFPSQLVHYAIWHTCPKDGVVMDPLAGTGTTGFVAQFLSKGFIMIEKNETKYWGIRGRLGLA